MTSHGSRGIGGRDDSATGGTLVIGRLFPPPRNPPLRKLYRAALVAKGRLAWRRRPATEPYICIGTRIGLAQDVDSDETSNVLAAKDDSEIRPNFDDAAAGTLEVTQALIDAAATGAYPSLRYRGLNLPYLCRRQFQWMLGKAFLVREEIGHAVRSHRPEKVLVENPFSIEQKLADAVMREAGLGHGAQPASAKWLSFLELKLQRLFLIVYTVVRELRFTCGYAEVVRGQDGGRFSRDAGAGHILFMSMGVPSTRATLPVLEHLIRTSSARLSIVFPSYLKSEVEIAVEQAGGKLRNLRFFRPARASRLIYHLFTLGRFKRELGRTGLRFHGVSLAEILESSNSLFSDVMMAVVKTWIDLWAREIRCVQPSVIFTASAFDWRFKVVGGLAERSGAQTVSAQDGVFFETPILACVGSKHSLVAGHAVKEFMRTLGIPENDLHVVGLPQYDRAHSEPRRARPGVCADLGLDPSRPIVLVITHHRIHLQQKADEVSAVLDAGQQLSNAQFVFKLHPYERDDVVRRLIAERGDPASVRVCQTYDTLDLIAASDAVVLRHSSCGVEAMIFDKPVIVLNLSGESDMVPFAREGAALGVYRRDELEAALRTALDDQETIAVLKREGARFLDRWIGGVDGRAALRSAHFINRLAAGAAADVAGPACPDATPAAADDGS